jgi:two-component system, sensor histidine kinase and response regulator
MRSRPRLLIVEDEPLIRQKVILMLSGWFDISSAEDAASAKEALKEQFDVIILDIMLPDGNGIDICREIKAADQFSTVIVSSSMETIDAWDAAFRAGADGYLEKRELLQLDPRKTALMAQNLIERNTLRRRAEELNRKQKHLLSIFSHDVRAPFQALLGTIELLRKNEIPPSAAKNVEILYNCAKDQVAFINSLLELMRLESKSVALRTADVDINIPVGHAVQTLRILAESKNIDLVIDLGKDLPKITGDVGRISQLTGNLISNAIKFTRRGGRIKVVTRSKSDEKTGVELVVSDNGIGINPSEKARIFEPFHRGKEKGTEGERGTGLGLSICQEIVHMHDGRLDVETGTKGTIFTAFFPTEKVELAAVG